MADSFGAMEDPSGASEEDPRETNRNTVLEFLGTGNWELSRRDAYGKN